MKAISSFFANMIKEQQRIEMEERKKDRKFFLKLGKAIFRITVEIK